MYNNRNWVPVSVVLIYRIITCRGFVPTNTIKLYPNAVLLNKPHTQKLTSSTTARNSVAISVLDTFFREAPYTAAFVTCSIKASVADIVAQKYEKKGNSDDDTEVTSSDDELVSNNNNSKDNIKRNIAFLLYGGLYQGCLQVFLINTIYPKLFGTGHDLVTVLSKTFFDNFISGPLLCLPLAYSIKGLIMKTSLRESLKRCWYEVRYNGLLFKYWSVWIPAQCLTFSVIPDHLRVLFIAGVAFFWLIFLSMVTCKEDAECIVEGICNIDQELPPQRK